MTKSRAARPDVDAIIGQIIEALPGCFPIESPDADVYDRLRPVLRRALKATAYSDRAVKEPDTSKDSMGVSIDKRAVEMSDEEAATWLDLIMLDGYRTSVHVAMRKVLTQLRAPAAEGLVSSPARPDWVPMCPCGATVLNDGDRCTHCEALEDIRLTRDLLWNKSRSPEGIEEERAFRLASRLNDAIVKLTKKGAR